MTSLGMGFIGGQQYNATSELPTASATAALQFAATGSTTRFDKDTTSAAASPGIKLPAGDWSLGIHCNIPTDCNSTMVLMNAATSSSNPYSSNSTFSITYRKADGRIAVIGYDSGGATLGVDTPILPSGNTNSNALISRHPLIAGRSCMITVVKTGNLAQLWLTYDGHAPIKTAEHFTSIGAIDNNIMSIGIGRDSSNSFKGKIRNFFKVSYALTKDQIAQVYNGASVATFGTPAADDYLYAFDTNAATITDTINSINMRRVFDNATVSSGVGYAAQTNAVFVDPLGADGCVIQQVNGSASIALSGIYYGTGGGNIEAQFIDQDGNCFQGWRTVASGISGNTWSGSVDCPKGKRWNRLQIRKTTLGIPSADVMTTTLRFGVGENVILIGQSLMDHMFSIDINTTWNNNGAASKYGSSTQATVNGFVSHNRDIPAKYTVTAEKQFAVSTMADNGSGLIRVTAAANHGLSTGEKVYICGTVGTTEANGVKWTVTVISRTVFDLQGSTFTNAYISGGTVYSWKNSTTIFDPTYEAVPDAAAILGNAISNMTGSVVCLSDQANGGQAINQFNSFSTTGGQNCFAATSFLAADAMRNVANVLWLHGHQNIGQTSYFMDSGSWGSETGYGELGTLYELYKVHLPNTTSFNLGVAAFHSIGGTTAASAANIHGFRQAAKRWVDRKIAGADTKPYFLGWFNDLQPQWENGTTQNAHLSPTSKGYMSQASRLGASCAYKILSNTSYQVGPSITSATRSGAVVDLTITHTGGSDLTWSRIADGSMPSGFEVATDTAFTAKLTISSITKISATQIRITLSADPAATVYIRYQYGMIGDYATSYYFTPRITGVADNGAGLIRVTCAPGSPLNPTTSQKGNTGHLLSGGEWVRIEGVAGSIQANGVWQVAYVSATEFDLVGSSSVGLSAFTAGSNLWQASATGVVSVELGLPIYDNQTVGGWDTLGLPLQPTYTHVTAT